MFRVPDAQCSSCHEEFNNGNKAPVWLACNHHFCKECLRVWLLGNHNNTCPICRAVHNVDQIMGDLMN